MLTYATGRDLRALALTGNLTSCTLNHGSYNDQYQLAFNIEQAQWYVLSENEQPDKARNFPDRNTAVAYATKYLGFGIASPDDTEPVKAPEGTA